MDTWDVVVVGGGIAGSALASVLARSGMSVLVLERQLEFRDRVRGENMQPWGAAEAQRMGLETTLLEAGGGYCATYVGYDETRDPAAAEAAPLPVGMLVEGVPGALNVGHPQASDALNRRAERDGATVLRGVTDVEVTAGRSPTVRYAHGGATRDASCRLVVGADGRQSSTRRALDIGLEQVDSPMALGGVLVGDSDWPADRAVVGTSGDAHFIAFPRPNGFVRLYAACAPGERTSGASREQTILDAYRVDCIPGSDRLSEARVAGPAAFVQGSDAWTDRVAVDGAVLVGDAAGWSDPIIGQGLSVAMRDVRTVADVLTGGDDWSPEAFEPYATERAERMRRLRILAALDTELRCTFTDAGRARRTAFNDALMGDPMMLAMFAAMLAGPELGPTEAFEQEHVDRVLALT